MTIVCASGLLGCDSAHSRSTASEPTAPTSAPPAVPSAAAAASASAAPFQPAKVALEAEAMTTSVHFVAYTTPQLDEPRLRAAFDGALGEMRRLENALSEWKPDSDVSRINLAPGEWTTIGPDTIRVIERGLWAGKLSEGRFDITFQALSKIWRFGTAQEEQPRVPSATEVAKLRKRVDYRRVDLDEAGSQVRIGEDQQLGLGGISKGYIVDSAAKVLKAAGVQAFLLQAGGDLFGAGRKPDGAPWVSGIRDPRGASDHEYFAALELTDHAFSTAGDYARQYVVGGKRYHHIIDPKTGYPATACRSVTVWAPDATTADGLDDAVFILGPEAGMKLVESIDGVGAVIVDAKNQLFVSERVKGRLKVLRQPTDAP